MVEPGRTDLESLGILLIEDNPGDVRLTQERLRDVPFESWLQAFDDEDDALAFLRKDGEHAHAPRPDVILLDLHVPGMDPAELLDRLDADPGLAGIPVIVLTGTEPVEDPRDRLGPRVRASLVKPLDVDKLLEALDR